MLMKLVVNIMYKSCICKIKMELHYPHIVEARLPRRRPRRELQMCLGQRLWLQNNLRKNGKQEEIIQQRPVQVDQGKLPVLEAVHQGGKSRTLEKSLNHNTHQGVRASKIMPISSIKGMKLAWLANMFQERRERPQPFRCKSPSQGGWNTAEKLWPGSILSSSKRPRNGRTYLRA